MRNWSEPWLVGYRCVAGSRAASARAAITGSGVGRSGSPIPRLITSTPSRRFWAIFRSSSANRYGGTASRRFANLTAQSPVEERIDRSVQTDARAKLARPEIGIASDASQPELLGELDRADLLGRPRQRRLPVTELHQQITTCEVHRHRALAPAVGDAGRAGGNR